MEDKKFEEIMRKYVSGKSRGKAVDFAKLEGEECATPRRKPKLVWASLSCIFLVVVTLAVVLPLTLSQSDNTPSPFYCASGDIKYVYLDSTDEIATEYHISATLPNIEWQEISCSIMKSKIDDRILGANLVLTVFDEYFDDIEIDVIAENNIVDSFLPYELYEEETEWNGVTVKYYVTYIESFENYYTTKIFFRKDGYKYYLKAQHIEEMGIADMLDKIF